MRFGRDKSGVTLPELNDSDRRHANTIRTGRVHVVDYSTARARILIGDPEDEGGHLITGWLPMPGGRAGGDVDWHPLEVGEDVVVVAEGGELQNGVVLPAGIYSNQSPPPGAKAGQWIKRFADGGEITYDRETGGWFVKGVALIELEASGARIVIAENVITLSAGGSTLTIDESGISFSAPAVEHDGTDIGSTHAHSGVEPGPGQTGAPL